MVKWEVILDNQQKKKEIKNMEQGKENNENI
jgi:hypothetical protein